MITYKKIGIDNREEVIQLIDSVLGNLERKEFFIPFTEEDLTDMFDEDKTIIYGAFENNKLVGMAQVYMQESYVYDIKKEINLDSNKVAELGGYLVLEQYRNRGIIKELEKILIKEAKDNGYEYLVITVHPENIPSNKATQFTGAKIVKTTKLGDYLRNIYLLKI